MAVVIRGLIEAKVYFTNTAKAFDGPEIARGMTRATGILKAAVMNNFVGYRSPSIGGVDTGVTRASINRSVKMGSSQVVGIVGSPRISAAVMETGSKPHWPPLKALEGWAKRHGTTAYVVARAISKRGNVPRKFLSKAMNSTYSRVMAELNRTVKSIIK